MIFDVLILVDISTYVNMRMQCCERLFDGVIEEEGATRTAAIFAALADPVRLRIVSMLAAAPKGTACGCELEDPSDWPSRLCPIISASFWRQAWSLGREAVDGSTIASSRSD